MGLWPERTAGAVSGVVVGAAALAVGQLVAAAVATQAAPVPAVAQQVIDLSPEWLKRFAIGLFGTRDKLALSVGILVVLFFVAAGVGVAARRRSRVAGATVLLLGVVGCLSALRQPGSSLVWIAPTVVGTAVAGLGFAWLRPGADTATDSSAREGDARPGPAGEAGTLDRRRFLGRALTLGGVAVGATVASPFLSRRLLAGSISRATVHIPAPADVESSVPGAPLRVRGLTPLFTPNASFYRVDTAFLVPQISAASWRLRIHGMVDREIELDFHDLLSRTLVERDITLTCVSNPVGGGLAGNARWVGVPLKPLLAEAGVRSGATQIVGRSPDGMTIGTPTAVALDGRDSMLAVQMNGQPLPLEHGFPVRMLVPGLYGYESACKWLVDLELTTDALAAYWVQQGWARYVPMKTECRIDTPASGDRLTAGRAPVAGVAWAGDRGIEAVQVRVDGGPWHEATLGPDAGVDAWRQWVWYWQATPGSHLVEARATDGTGAVQTARATAPFPSGATGWPRAAVGVS